MEAALWHSNPQHAIIPKNKCTCNPSQTPQRHTLCPCPHPRRRAAEYLLTHMPPGRYRGVTYFCRDEGSWMILDTAGSLAPRTSSHLREAETLALFDDARCRGSDLQLRQTAVGLLTLAAGMPKDKLMQAAGRMRQLGRGQTLLVMGLPDITAKISAAAAAGAAGTSAASGGSAAQSQRSSVAALAGSKLPFGRPKGFMHLKRKKPQPQSTTSSSTSGRFCKPCMQDVLSWVLYNTVQGTLSGVPQAASQGLPQHTEAPQRPVCCMSACQ